MSDSKNVTREGLRVVARTLNMHKPDEWGDAIFDALPEPPASGDVEAARRRHWDAGGFCNTCGGDWPCSWTRGFTEAEAAIRAEADVNPEFHRGWMAGRRYTEVMGPPPASGDVDLRCSAIWNGCNCDRRPHEGDGHIWRNSLDGQLVDPARYPALPADPTPPASEDVEAARDNLRAVIVGQSYEDRIDAFEAAIRAESGLDPLWRQAIEAHMGDFLEQPESFDTFEAVGVNIARHRARLGAEQRKEE